MSSCRSKRRAFRQTSTLRPFQFHFVSILLCFWAFNKRWTENNKVNIGTREGRSAHVESDRRHQHRIVCWDRLAIKAGLHARNISDKICHSLAF